MRKTRACILTWQIPRGRHGHIMVLGERSSWNPVGECYPGQVKLPLMTWASRIGVPVQVPASLPTSLGRQQTPQVLWPCHPLGRPWCRAGPAPATVVIWRMDQQMEGDRLSLCWPLCSGHGQPARARHSSCPLLLSRLRWEVEWPGLESASTADARMFCRVPSTHLYVPAICWLLGVPGVWASCWEHGASSRHGSQ